MIIESCQFFQPVTLKVGDGKRSPLITAATNKTHDIERDELVIKIRQKGSLDYTHVTLMNTCWYIPLETVDAPSTSKANPPGEAKTRVKRNPVAPVKLPTTD
jgi:hypothetical protein